MDVEIKSPIRTEPRGDILVVEIDNPPVNAGSWAVRKGLVDAVAVLEAGSDLRACVIVGAGSTFVSGSDIREFNQSLSFPSMAQVIEAIRACSKPVVSALHGFAFGGGFELALGCDARIAMAGTQVGLPEVTLGILPAAGGTQRVPRCVGLARAIRLICTGERITAEQALEFGLVDRVVPGNLLPNAIDLARSLNGEKRDLLDRQVPAEDEATVFAAEQAGLRAGKRRPAVVAAIASIRNAARLDKASGMAAERALFDQLQLSDDAVALRYQFFAEREAVKLPAEIQVKPRVVQTLAVIGAGTMGAGIAINALDVGLEVLLLEQDAEGLERGVQRIQAYFNGRVADGKLSKGDAASRISRLTATLDWSLLSGADAVIEAVFEDLTIKQGVFRKIDAFARPGAVLATNTSYLDIDAVAAATRRPQDVLGLHFFSPANVMKLLEVVKGRDTVPDVLATGMALGKRLRKTPVLCGNAFGFIGNRIFNAYRKQCEYMLEDGAWPEEVDQALEALGLAMGPFSVADLSGLDIAWRMRKAQAAQRDPRERYVDILDRLCEQGRFGRKAGAGYYLHESGKAAGKASDAMVREIIEQASARRGLKRRPLSTEEIQRRALLAMVNEAALLMRDNVASRASDIDVVLAQGYGLPRWVGGPVFWARRQDPASLRADLQRLAESSGHGFVPGDVSTLINS